MNFLYPLYASATSLALVMLLLAVLRHRRPRPPLPLLLGTFLGCVGMLFPLASMVIGIERLNELIHGNPPGGDLSSGVRMGEVEVGPKYLVIQQLFGLLSQVSVLLIGIGFLLMVRRRITESLQPATTP